jgi:hypothetical protein
MSTATGITSDALGAVPVTKHGDAHATLVDGTVIQPGSGTTPRQHLFTSAAIVLVAAFILLGGARFLRNARIA